MISRVVTYCAAVVLMWTSLLGQPRPRTFVIDPGEIMQIKKDIQNGSKDYATALDKLTHEAQKALLIVPPSVMAKQFIPPSGSKHDYMSMGKYWWPDPKKPNGLPYVRRDGIVNPEVEKITDHDNMLTMINGVLTLATAYYYLGNDMYAEGAARLLRVWFLDTATCMRPNLKYAQAVAGRNEGRGSGILDAHEFAELIDAIGMLEGSPLWTAADRKGLQAWFEEYCRWMRESPNGRDEAKAQNNHGSWYDVQYAVVLLFLGKEDDARTLLESVKERRIAVQIEPDGSQPKELQRTRSYHYSLFNLNALCTLARIGQKLGVDLWHFQTQDGRGIKKAFEHLLPYITGEKKWEHEQIDDVKSTETYPLLMEASRAYGDKRFSDAASQLHNAPKLSQASILYRR